MRVSCNSREAGEIIALIMAEKVHPFFREDKFQAFPQLQNVHCTCTIGACEKEQQKVRVGRRFLKPVSEATVSGTTRKHL